MSKAVLVSIFILFLASGNCQSVVTQDVSLPSFDCGFCEFVITLVYGFLTANSTESEIVHTVDSICNYVPTSLNSLCKSFIDEFGPSIIFLIVQHETPRAVCTYINLCNETIALNATTNENCDFCTLLSVKITPSTISKPIKNFIAYLFNQCDEYYSDKKNIECKIFSSHFGYWMAETLLEHFENNNNNISNNKSNDTVQRIKEVVCKESTKAFCN